MSVHISQPTPYPDVNVAVNLMLSNMQAILGDQLIGLYLGGSLALGDFTLASALLAIVTLLVPVGLLLTLIFAWRARAKTWVNLLHSIAAVFALQWCVILIAAAMLPLRLWAY